MFDEFEGEGLGCVCGWFGEVMGGGKSNHTRPVGQSVRLTARLLLAPDELGVGILPHHTHLGG